jgi:predicted anti-sigma-YlaC factor YlaD
VSAVELTCRELVELLTDWLERALPEADRARVDAHLDGCADCRAHLGQMLVVIALTERLGEEPEDHPGEWVDRSPGRAGASGT